MARVSVEADHDSLKGRFLGTCVGAEVEDLEAYDSTEKLISHRMMRRYFTHEEFIALSELFRYEISPKVGLTMKNDWHISFGRGFYQGQRVLCIHHSAIHHFYKIKQDKRYAVHSK